ncbi:MAG: RNA polymerase sigma factor [Bacteroidales bacterium]
MHKNISEEKLIEGCIEGNRYAQKMLFEKYRSLMFAICMRYAKSKNEAEDVMIEGFMKIYSSLSEFKKKGSFEGWLKRIMVNAAINNYRSNLKHYYNTTIDDDNFLEIRDEKDNFKTNYSAEYLINLIQGLPDGYRMVFNLYEIEGYSHKEIAEIMNISISTAKTQLFYAKKTLQKKLTKINQDEMY